jgi:hypothetical protein
MADRSKSEAVDVPEHENRTDSSSRVDGRGHCGRFDRDVTHEEFSKRKGVHTIDDIRQKRGRKCHNAH